MTEPRAVLFDRDGTLVVDVPYNGDPERVDPVPKADEALAALRAAHLAVGLVTNQSGVARGLLSRGQVDAVKVHDRVDRAGGDIERGIEAGGGQQVVHAVDERDDGPQPAGHGQHQPVIGA